MLCRFGSELAQMPEAPKVVASTSSRAAIHRYEQLRAVSSGPNLASLCLKSKFSELVQLQQASTCILNISQVRPPFAAVSNRAWCLVAITRSLNVQGLPDVRAHTPHSNHSERLYRLLKVISQIITIWVNIYTSHESGEGHRRSTYEDHQQKSASSLTTTR